MRRGVILFLLIIIVFPLIYADGPHPVYVEIRNSSNAIPEEGNVSFQAWLLSNPNEILDEYTTDCYYPAFTSYVKVNCGQFSTWNNTDVLHLEVTEISSGETGYGEYQLSYDASQFFSITNGGIFLGGGGGPAEINLPDSFTMNEDEPLTEDFSQYITGISLAIETYNATNFTFEVSGSNVTMIPTENFNGNEELMFGVVSLDSSVDIDTVLVEVLPVNDAPILNLPQQFQFNEDGSFEQDISSFASDLEGDEISFFALGSDHIAADVEGTILNMTADPDWNGSEYITITASDGRTRDSSSMEVMVVVNPVNDVPVIALPEQMTFWADLGAVANFADYIADIDGDDLTITYYGEDDLEIEINGYEVTFDYDAGWHGSDEIIFTVSDNILRASASDTMTVNIFYPEDTVLSCDDYLIDDGDDLVVPIQTTEFFEQWSAVSFNMEFNFNPQVLSYQGYNLSGTLLESGTLSIVENEPGNLSIAYMHYLPITGNGDLFVLEFSTVCFGESELDIESCLMNSGSLTNFIDGSVTVNDIGLTHPPVADAGTDFGVLSGSQGTLDGSASYDPDGDDITWLWNAPPEIILDDETAAITDFTAPIVTEDTEFVVTLSVSDGEFTTNDFITISVIYTNHQPNIELPDEFSFNEDEQLIVDFEQFTSDLDDDELTLSVSGNENILVDFNELQVTFSAQENWSGSETLTFVVSDGVMLRETSDDVTVSVNAVNDPPHADAGMDLSGRDGEVIALDGSASWDVETEELEYIWIAPTGIILDDPYSINPTFTAPQVVDPTEYQFTLQVNDGQSTDDDMIIVTILDDEPTLLNIEDQTNNSALFTWFAPGTGGSGQELDQGFEGIAPPQGWLNIDNDEDGYGWYILNENPHSGSGCIASDSYANTALTPDNWIISPPVQIGGLSALSYWIAAEDEFYPEEHYSVLISTSGTAPENFTEVITEETLQNDTWQQRTFSLQQWAGSTVNIAWRHHDVTNQLSIKLDDVQIYNTDDRSITNNSLLTSSEPEISSVKTAFRDRELLGYNVYLDDDMLGFVEIRQYLFTDVFGTYQAGVQAVYDDGESEIVYIEFIVDNDEDLHLITGINKIYPNPFNPETQIEFSLQQSENVKIDVYNVKGQKVASLCDEALDAGVHNITWKADNMPSAVYFLQIAAGNYHKIEKLLLLK